MLFPLLYAGKGKPTVPERKFRASTCSESDQRQESQGGIREHPRCCRRPRPQLDRDSKVGGRGLVLETPALLSRCRCCRGSSAPIPWYFVLRRARWFALRRRRRWPRPPGLSGESRQAEAHGEGAISSQVDRLALQGHAGVGFGRPVHDQLGVDLEVEVATQRTQRCRRQVLEARAAHGSAQPFLEEMLADRWRQATDGNHCRLRRSCESARIVSGRSSSFRQERR